VKGSEVFRYLNFAGILSSKVSGVSVFNQGFKKTPRIQITRGGGILHSKLTVLDGKVIYPSDFNLSSSELEVSAYDFHVYGKGLLQGNVFKYHHEDEGQLTIKMSEYFVVRAPIRKKILNGKNFKLKVESNSLQLTSLFKNVWLSLNMPEVSIPDIQFLNEVLDKMNSKVRVLSGKGLVEFSLHAQSGDVSWKESDPHQGRLRLGVRNLKVDLEKFFVKGDLESKFFFDPVDFNSSQLKVPFGEFFISNVSWKTKDHQEMKEKDQNWWMIGKIFTEQLQFNPKIKSHGKLRIQAKDTLPVVDYLKRKKNLSRLKAAAISTESIVGEADYSIEPPIWSLNWIQMKGNSRNVEGVLRKDEFFLDGALKISLGIVSVGTYFHENQSEFKLFPSDEWLYKKVQSFRQKD
jgi:hypothetical protein